MSALSSALYAGTVMHQRLRPVRHRLRYRMFCLLLNLDELPVLHARLRLFSLNGFNLFSFHERDHGAPPGVRLRDHIDAQLAAAGIPAGGAVHLLAMPRLLGFAFNPLSIYLCQDKVGGLAAVIYEVRNTFGERHRYVIQIPAGQANAAVLRHSFAKRFHVSPFMDMDLKYHFVLTRPVSQRDGLHVAINTADDAGPVLVAQLSTARQHLDDRTLLRSFVSHPLLGLKVLAGIHWEALSLLLKGAAFRRHPGPPEQPATIIRLHDTR